MADKKVGQNCRITNRKTKGNGNFFYVKLMNFFIVRSLLKNLVLNFAYLLYNVVRDIVRDKLGKLK